MATYKAEFLSHYYEGRLRPRTPTLWAGSTGGRGSPAYVPQLANLVRRRRPGCAVLRNGRPAIHPDRTIPAFAPYTFQGMVSKGGVPRMAGGKSDPLGRIHLTITSIRRPPRRRLRCWRRRIAVEVPDAASVLRTSALRLGHARQAKRCLVPLCAIGRGHPERDPGGRSGAELRVGVPGRADRECFRTGRMRSGFGSRRFSSANSWEESARLPTPAARAPRMVHGHCHHKSVMGMGAEEKTLEKMRRRFEMPDTGCCGMAGAFGFEKHKFDIAMKCGERVLLPRSARRHRKLSSSPMDSVATSR